MPNTVSPEKTVENFIAAMNAWEIASSAARYAAKHTDQPDSYQPGVRQSQAELFAIFCTPKERTYGRQGSFSRPPEYDPNKEQVVNVELAGSTVVVETKRNATLYGGSYRYKVKRIDGKWLIDSCARLSAGKWKPSIL